MISNKTVRPLPGLVKFRELHSAYNLGDDIFVAVEYPDGFHAGYGDWIGLYPVGWNQLDQFVGYQQAPQPIKRDFEAHRFLHTFVFKTKSVQLLSYYGLFQFIYVSQMFGGALGKSDEFGLDPNSNCTEYTTSKENNGSTKSKAFNANLCENDKIHSFTETIQQRIK